MSDCEHETNYYVEQDAPIFRLGGQTIVTYRCNKCHKQIYREKPWESWKELDVLKADALSEQNDILCGMQDAGLARGRFAKDKV